MLMNELVFTKMKLKSQRKGVELAVSIFGSFVLWFGYLDRVSLFSFLIIQYQESSFISKIFFSRNRIREDDLQNFSITNSLYFSPYSCWKNLPVSSKSIWDLVRNYGWKELEIYFKKNHRKRKIGQWHICFLFFSQPGKKSQLCVQNLPPTPSLTYCTPSLAWVSLITHFEPSTAEHVWYIKRIYTYLQLCFRLHLNF